MNVFTLDSLEVLGMTKPRFEVIAHALPVSTGVDGVLGLDFVRGHLLTIDLIQGWVSLE